MSATMTHYGHEVTMTTEHAASSYGIAVILIDGELVDGHEGARWALLLAEMGDTEEIREAAARYLEARPPHA
jgi:hypothetical protein